MEDELEFNVDPWDWYSYPTEEELLERDEWYRKEEERFYQQWIERDMELERKKSQS